MNTLTDLITTLRDLNVPEAAIRAAAKKNGFSDEDIESSLPKTERKRGFRAEYFDYLVDALPTDEEAEAWIRAYPDISKNEIAHIKVRLKEAALARAVANR